MSNKHNQSRPQQPQNRPSAPQAAPVPPTPQAPRFDPVEAAKVAAQVPEGERLPDIGVAATPTYIEETLADDRAEKERLRLLKDVPPGMVPGVPRPPTDSRVADPEAAGQANPQDPRVYGTLPELVPPVSPGKYYRVMATKTVRANGVICTFKEGRLLLDTHYEPRTLEAMQAQGLKLEEVPEDAAPMPA